MAAAAPRRRIALPVVGQEGGIRRSRAGAWRAASLVLVHLAILAHVIHWLATGTTLTPLEPSEGMELGRRGVVNAGLILFVVAGAATAIFGRFFCGWGCHLVALQDLCQSLLRRLGIRPVPLRSRLLAWVPTLGFFYMFLWPGLWRAISGDELGPLRRDFVTSDFWATFPGWGGALATLAVCGFAIVYLLGAKGFCTYACPYGALFAAADRLAPVRIRVSEACDGCAHCTAVCTSNVRVHEEVRRYGMVVDSGCMKCLDCVSVCPRDALAVRVGRPALGAPARDSAAIARPEALAWKDELVLAAAFALAFFSLRGLYGLVPFLLALGLAGCIAYAIWTTIRLAGAENLALRRVQLRRHGRLTAAGRGWAVGSLLATAVVLHSAVVQGQLFLGELAESRLAVSRDRVFSGGDFVLPDRSEVERARRALSHLERADRLGLARQPGLALRMSWLALVADEPARLSVHATAAAAEPGQAAPAWILVGLRHEQGGRLDLAAAAYRRAVEAAPSRADAHLRLGLSLVRAGDLAAARQALEAGIRQAGIHPDLTYNRALVLGLSGDFEGAIDGFRRTLAVLPSHRPSRENLAALLAELGRDRESAEVLSAGGERVPTRTGESPQ